MPTLTQIILFIHILAGITTLLAGPIAIWYHERHPQRHRLFGRVFFWAMAVVCGSSAVGFVTQPERVFYQFLLGIAVLTGAEILRGIRAIQLMKGGTVQRLDFAYTAALGVNGGGLLAVAAYHFMQGEPAVFPILMTVAGLGSLAEVRVSLRAFRRAAEQHRLDWLRLHVASMLTAFMASSTAFTVNVAYALPWWAQWFGPTLLLLPLQFYFGRKIKLRKARLAVAPAA